MSLGDKADRIPVIVRPDTPAKIAVQMSTFTYLSYANKHLSFDAQIAQAIVVHTTVITADDIEYNKLQESGLSTYDITPMGPACFILPGNDRSSTFALAIAWPT